MIYVASRVRHAPMWRGLRAAGHPIVSTWIDEAGDDETDDFSALWDRILDEIVNYSFRLLLYARPDDFPLKGALVEVGIAMASDTPITVCLPGVIVQDRTMRPIGSWVLHSSVTRQDDIHKALR